MNPDVLRSLRTPNGRVLWASQVLRYCGFADGRVPAQGFSPRLVGDTVVWADPVTPGQFRIRVVCACPRCGKMGVPAGRLRQHQTARACVAAGESTDRA